MRPAIVVTGAASGIGRALALRAARDGMFMLLVDLSQTPLEQVATELVEGGAQVHALAIDLLEANAGERIERALSERELYCDVLVNSAGLGLYGAAAEVDRRAQMTLVDVNARALTELTLRFLPGMVKRGRGGVLNLGSITSYAPGPKMAVYHATKAYVRLFSSALAAEVAGTGVTVTCLNPGVVRTPLLATLPMQNYLMKFMPRTNADDTAEAGWRGFRAGKSVVLPRLSDWVTRAFLLVLPDRLAAALILTLQRSRHPSQGGNTPSDGKPG